MELATPRAGVEGVPFNNTLESANKDTGGLISFQHCNEICLCLRRIVIELLVVNESHQVTFRTREVVQLSCRLEPELVVGGNVIAQHLYELALVGRWYQRVRNVTQMGLNIEDFDAVAGALIVHWRPRLGLHECSWRLHHLEAL